MTEPTQSTTPPGEAPSRLADAEGGTASRGDEEPRADATHAVVDDTQPDAPDHPVDDTQPDAPDDHPETASARHGTAPPAARPGPPRPRPRATPGPPGRPRTGRPVPGRPVPGPPQATAAAPQVHDAQEAANAASFGRVDEDGTVWVREADGERSVGQYPGADAKEALAFYVVRFLDLQAQVALLEARLGQLQPKELDHTVDALRTALEAPAAVGDLSALRERLDKIAEAAAERRATAAAQREAARAEAVVARTTLVEEAEAIAAADPAKTQWRQAGERLRGLLEEWKDAQRHGPRIDKPTEDALWKRFSAARATFDRGRRQFFAEQDHRRAEAKAAKEQLIEEAERLSTSTDWAATAAGLRALMNRWKAAGRAAAREDDELWQRFRAAQDRFFAARQAAGSAQDEELEANLRAKLALVDEAEALVPVQDLGRTRGALRSIQERWEAVGKVPRSEVARVEGRLRAVEQAVRDAQQQAWGRRNPEVRSRAEGAAAQLEASIAVLEADLRAAEADGDARTVRAAQDALAARKAWLAQVRRTADEIR